jgi:hypothetical protein
MRDLTFWFGIFAIAILGCSSDSNQGAKELTESSAGGVQLLRDVDGRIAVVRGRFAAPRGDSVETRAMGFADTYRDALGLDAAIEIGRPSVTGGSLQTVTFALSAGGHPIEGARLRMRLAAAEVLFVSVSVPSQIPQVLEPELDADQARAVVFERFPNGTSRGAPRLVIHAPALWTGSEAPPRLAWRVPIHAGDVSSAPDVFIDALDGAELGTLEHVHLARERKVYDARGYRSEVDLKDHRLQHYDETGPIAGITPTAEATLAWNFAARGCGFLETHFGSVGPCDPLVMYVNYGEPPGWAAMYAGELQFAPDALSDPREGMQTYMHELGHALIRWETDEFNYYGESGAIHESIADVFAMLVTEPDRWVVDAGHPFERNLSDPNAAGNPATYADRVLGPEDEGEVHINSVILSHALWLATIEGLEWRQETVEGMGQASMAAILDQVLSGYLSGHVSLHQAAVSLIDACMVHPLFRDLFGGTGANISFRDCGLLVNALAEVGLSEPDDDLDGWPNDADNCPTRSNPYQEDADGNRKGDICEDSGTEPSEPSNDPGVFPCPPAFETTEAGSWKLTQHWGSPPSCCPLVPVYDYLCRYGRPAGTPTKYPQHVTLWLHWATEARDGIGCDYPPPNPGSGISSETHSAYLEYSSGSISFTPGSTFYDELATFGTELLDLVERGADDADQKVLPGGAARCQ